MTVGELDAILDNNLVPDTQLLGAGAKGVDPEVHGSKGEAPARGAGEGSRDAQAPQARGRGSGHGGRRGRRVAVKHSIIVQAYIYARQQRIKPPPLLAKKLKILWNSDDGLLC